MEPQPAKQAAPCVECGTTGGRVEGRCVRPWRRLGHCDRCYSYKRQHGLIANGPDHPVAPPAVVTPAMLGVARRAIAARCQAARARVADEEARAGTIGAAWRARHAEQFGEASLRRIFGDGIGAAYWHDGAAAA